MRLLCTEHMEKQEVGMKWKMETEMEMQSLSCVLERFVCRWPLFLELSPPPVFDHLLC